MVRVLQIPELLRNIFGYLDTRSQVSCALVCKRWSETALDVLWKELDSPIPLFSLLSPLEEIGGVLELQRPVKIEDWNVFYRYARRVRGLWLDFVKSHWSPCIFFELAQKRPNLTLLPNLSELRIGAKDAEEFVHSLLFMSNNVKWLVLRLPDEESLSLLSDDAILEFFKECTARMPNLRRFDMCTLSDELSAANVQEHVARFLSSLTDLVTFNCSLYFATTSVITSLSHLQDLRVISFEYPRESGCGLRTNVVPFYPSISPGAFPALVDLSFSATFKDAAKFMDMDCAPNLTSLYIHSPDLESADSLHDLLMLLSRRRQQLNVLCLSSVPYGVYEPLRDENGHKIDRVTLQTLLPLLDFPNLAQFEATYHCPFQLSNLDLEKLLAKWRALEHFHLCSDPLLKETPMLTPEVLPIIAKCCPKLRTLSLYLNTHVTNPTVPNSSPVDPTKFTFLRDINFGLSPLAEEDISGFARYLSELLPSTISTEGLFGTSWLIPVNRFYDGFDMKEEDVLRWSKLSWALKMLIKAREQERERARDLEREAKDLAMRVAVLEEQRRVGLSAVAATGNTRICVHQ